MCCQSDLMMMVMYTKTNTLTHICISICIYVRTCIYIRTYVFVYAYMCTDIYIWICIYCDGYCIFVPRLLYPGKTGRISVDSTVPPKLSVTNYILLIALKAHITS